MAAVKKATDYVLAEPDKAYADYVDMKPLMGTELNRKIFERSFAYFSKDLQNVKRDWVSPQPVLFPFFFFPFSSPLVSPNDEHRSRSPTTASASACCRPTTSPTTPTRSWAGSWSKSRRIRLPTRGAWPPTKPTSRPAEAAGAAMPPRRL